MVYEKGKERKKGKDNSTAHSAINAKTHVKGKPLVSHLTTVSAGAMAMVSDLSHTRLCM